MRWKVYYADGSEYLGDGRDEWFDAPARGLIAIAVLNESVGREVMTSTDYYVWWPGATYPWSVDKAGLWDFLYEAGSELAGCDLGNGDFGKLIELGVKFGRSMDTPAYMQRLDEILSDPDLPVKSALSVREVLR
jgi:hypothetical protein